MHSPLTFIRKAGLFGGLSLLLIAGPAVADIPDNLTDIPYQSVEWGGEQLQARGYTYITGDYHNGKSHEYWWNRRTKTCIHARHDSSKYEMLKISAATDCNQYGSQATNSDNKDSNAAAAIAIGAAAILGAAALAHKSHERDDKYGEDSKSVAEFDRGYRDGLYHQSYHNYNNTQAYSDGYNSGQQKRDEQSRHRSYDGRHSGYHPYVALDDLVGARAAGADTAMRDRGFSDKGGYKQDGKSIVMWYNAETHQCVQSITRNGRISEISPIAEGNCR